MRFKQEKLKAFEHLHKILAQAHRLKSGEHDEFSRNATIESIRHHASEAILLFEYAQNDDERVVYIWNKDHKSDEPQTASPAADPVG